MTQRTVLTTILASLVLALPAITHAAEPSQTSGHPTRCESPYRKKPVPPKQLQAIVESHGQWLEQRENPEHQRANLCQADLRHAKLGNSPSGSREGICAKVICHKRVSPEPISREPSWKIAT